MAKHLWITLLSALILYLVTPGTAQITECPGGQYVATNQAGNAVCTDCDRDTYKEGTNDITTCTPCPDATPRNLVTGSDNATDCQYAACGQGQEIDETDPLQCNTCPVGQYQDKTYPLDIAADRCKACPDGTSTASDGSTSEECVVPCPAGEEDVGGTCTVCAINFYKEVTSNQQTLYGSCVQCPDAGFRTESTGATSASDCNIVTCGPGNRTDTVNNECVECLEDEFQNLEWEEECNDCPVNHGTQAGVTGAPDISFCFPFCGDGEELDDPVCVPCEIGYYKDNSEGRFENCTICPNPNFITASTGSTTLAECSIANCSAGSYRDTNACVPCATGTYQPDKWQTRCISCNPGETTEAEGSEDASDCVEVFTHTFLLGIRTTITCSINDAITNSSSDLSESLSLRAELITQAVVETSVNVNVDDCTHDFIGFRCFDDVLDILVQMAIDTTESDISTVEAALVNTFNTEMSDESLDHPSNNQVASITVAAATLEDDALVQSASLNCGNGRFSNLTALTCDQCEKGSFQPTDVAELCFPCDLGVTTAGNGAFGEEEDLCIFPEPADYTTHTFLVEIVTTIDCTDLYTDSTTDEYQSTSSNAATIVRNVLLSNLTSSLRLTTPVVNFIGFRCNSPVRILLEVQLTNIETSSTDTITSALNAIQDEITDGSLDDPDNTDGVDAIPIDITGQVTNLGNLDIADLDCPAGEQTDLETGECEPCPQGTYQPQNVPELCYDCPVGTTTVGTGTILPTGGQASDVCPNPVTDPIVIPDGFTFPDPDSGCPNFLYEGECYSACPAGTIANENDECEDDPDSDEKDTSATTIGIAVGSAAGGLFAVLLIAFLCVIGLRYCGRRNRYYNEKQNLYLDSSPTNTRTRSRNYESRGSYETARRPEPSRSSNWHTSDHYSGRAYSPYYYY